MEITILTTAKKLTKSIIAQMPFIEPKSFDNIEILGGLRNVRSKSSYVILAKDLISSQYFLLNPYLYVLEKSDDTTIRFNALPVITFENPIQRDEWFLKYTSILRNTPQIYI